MSLMQYIQGIRKGKDAHRLEKEAMHDPFLADALDGYDKIAGNHSKQIEKLRQNIARTSRPEKNRSRLFLNIAASIVALFTVGTGIGIYLLSTPAKQLEIAEQPANRMFEIQEQEPVDTLVLVQAEKTTEKQENAALIAQAETKAHTAPVIPKEVEIVADLAAIDAIVAESEPANKVVMEFTPPISDTPHLADNQLTGKVIDETGEPIVGATIVLAGTRQGTVTDIDGKFALAAGNNDQIQVSYIGYEPVTVPADKNKPLLIAMNESNNSLSEVVVTGYGSRKSVHITGSAAKILDKKESFDEYVKRALVRPSDEKCKNAKGMVTLTFRVDENGRPSDIAVKKSLCPSADREAVRLLEAGPDWPLTEKEVTKKIRF